MSKFKLHKLTSADVANAVRHPLNPRNFREDDDPQHKALIRQFTETGDDEKLVIGWQPHQRLYGDDLPVWTDKMEIVDGLGRSGALKALKPDQLAALLEQTPVFVYMIPSKEVTSKWIANHDAAQKRHNRKESFALYRQLRSEGMSPEEASRQCGKTSRWVEAEYLLVMIAKPPKSKGKELPIFEKWTEEKLTSGDITKLGPLYNKMTKGKNAKEKDKAAKEFFSAYRSAIKGPSKDERRKSAQDKELRGLWVQIDDLENRDKILLLAEKLAEQEADIRQANAEAKAEAEATK